MRRRDRSLPTQAIYSVLRGGSPDASGYFGEPQLAIGEVPRGMADAPTGAVAHFVFRFGVGADEDQLQDCVAKRR
jgi:hypothetical protein